MSDNPIDSFLKKKSDRAKEYRNVIEDMMGSGRYHYAEETLLSLLDHIETYGNITDKQALAIENIKAKPSHGY